MTPISLSVIYHTRKHGNGRSPVQYTQDAMDFYNRNKSSGKIVLLDGTKGIRITTKSVVNGKARRVGGLWTNKGKLVTFWV